ncbi:MAG: hypothetical protein KAJ18_10190 [Candidatus Omnitrophica bacterium]|nr:hypothetical protein [Candidatus Omnitrophota bacterium]
MLNPSIKYFFSCLLVTALIGCGEMASAPGPVRTLSEADVKFAKICREEFKYSVATRRLPNSVWIYLPLDGQLLDIKASDEGPVKMDVPSKQIKVLFNEAKFVDKHLIVKYDIAKTKSYLQDYGYQNVYTEEFTKKQNNILAAITRSYFEVEEVPGDITYKNAEKNRTHKNLVNAYVKAQKVPDFFILVIADVQKGIAVKSIVNFQDLKKYMSMTPAISPDEYAKRYISDIYGQASIVGDLTGAYLGVYNLTWQEFLSRQIENRIKFKYTRSDFPPTENTEEELMKIVAATLTAYDFDQVQSILLKDLSTGEPSAFMPEDLNRFRD